MSKSKRQTIGNDFKDELDGSPLDMLVAPKEKNRAMKVLPKTERVSKPSIEKKAVIQPLNGESQTRKVNEAKERMTVQISKDTIERVKDCVYWNRLTVAQFVEEALEAALSESEKHNGKPYPKRRSELKPGRPTK